jgi:mannose-1-phosphate guanylyltransferase
MVVETIERVAQVASKKIKPVIVTSAQQAVMVGQAFAGKGNCTIIGEPVGKNTAPAIACAASYIQQHYGDAVMVVLPADHSIRPTANFRACVRFAASLAQKQACLVIFGITPTAPETGYGYIQRGTAVAHQHKMHAFAVRRFKEKPSVNKARAYLKSKDYFWNSGIFVWRTSVILDEIRRSMPGLYEQTRLLAAGRFSAKALADFYRDCEKQSIDYGVMEKARKVLVVGGTFSWDDVGSWEAMSRLHKSTALRSAVVGAPVFEQECRDSIIVNKSGRALAAFGLNNVVLVATDDAVLAIDRKQLPAMRKFVADMKAQGIFSKELF